MYGASVSLVLASVVYAGWEFYQTSEGSKSESAYGDDYNKDSYADADKTEGDYQTDTAADHHRTLAGDSSYEKNFTNDPDNVAIWLLMSSVFVGFVWFSVQVVYWTFWPEGFSGKFKKEEHMVPMNVDYGIHR